MKYQTAVYRTTTKRTKRRRLLPLLAVLFVAAAFLYFFHPRLLLTFGKPDSPPPGDNGTKLPPEEPVDAPPPPPEQEDPKAEDPSPVEEPPAVQEPQDILPPGDDLPVIADGDYLLALVTKKTTLGDYEPADLVEIPRELWANDYPYKLRKEACEHLLVMWEAAQNDGFSFLVTSAYRSYSTQERLFANYAAAHGEEKANTFSARAGQSEHQLGTTVDLVVPGHSLSDSFGETDIGKWLAENSWKYGFVLSYPKGSTEITGYIYEPWHFRYIGVENAAAWREAGVTLTEWLMEQPQEWKD
ncbi:MAG: M15 family metallopeptidase [Firmicutes bacterium]|jgi:D-alanyl-D-alanine carboxypeptidase|nr:M15 family metallopeptidase [Bacillota bacterium]